MYLFQCGFDDLNELFAYQCRLLKTFAKSRAWCGSKLFDTTMVFLKDFFKKVDEKNQQKTEKYKNYLVGKELIE